MTQLLKRLADLASQSYGKNIYTFSDFISESALAEVANVKFQADAEVFGGCEFADRKMIKFGKDCYGSGEFPIDILKISPISAKFAVEISHRDVLGAVMNLGIVREKIGDIFCDGAVCYFLCERKISPYICENLSRVARNSVAVEYAFEIPASFAPKTQTERISVSSQRLDSVVCKLYNLSRESGKELFATQKVSISGVVCENNSKALAGGEVISVRGFGKFRYIGEAGISRKGKKYVEVEKFI